MAAECFPVSVSLDGQTRTVLDAWQTLSHSNRSEAIRRAVLLVASDPELSRLMTRPDFATDEHAI